MTGMFNRCGDRRRSPEGQVPRGPEFSRRDLGSAT